MWYKLFETLATQYHWTMDYCLWKLTFAQALTFIEISTERSKAGTEEGNKSSMRSLKEEFPIDDVSKLPTEQDVFKIWSGAYE